ncbi:wax ester synthase/diacylglycerol acyltransferase 4-like [Arachis stenosperma]|uniref:wax ester synthase/diacylglycerol acyltransferase 4-like n=1 Tax=Arachis stenosperma TaxID=217475 RepID=UPI0025AC16FF|nr:wax ester synthase/diacylglycerol acyltransferase 4-like [Arachis stenosperma]
MKNDFDEEEIPAEPVSPTGQYLNSTSLCVYILGVLESDVPIDDSHTLSLLQHVFLPINTRFSSIMTRDKNGEKKWMKVEVKLEDHIKVPKFPNEKSSSSLLLYDEDVDEYMSKIAMEYLPQNRPLWEIHIIKYPTRNAAGTLVFKLHHALGDGYSLMGALLSCLQRLDNPNLPFTLPSSNKKLLPKSSTIFKNNIFSSAFHSMSDFGWSILKSSLVEDDHTPIRSCGEDNKLRQVTISSVTFSFDHIKEVKSLLGVSINDVLAGLIFLGIRLYMQDIDLKSRNSQSTALVLFNTRNIRGYKSVKEMVEKSNNNGASWGNRFAFLHVPIPELSDSKYANPLEFIWDAQKEITRKKSSWATPLTAMFLNMVKRLRGSEAAARYVHSTLRNSSTTVSSIIGPVEQMALANHPIKGLYFMVVGPPESLTITIMSYIGKLRIAFGLEKGFMDKEKFKLCMEKSLEMIISAARNIST